jgi:hypothetical protein
MKFTYRITPTISEFTRTLKGDVRGAKRAGMTNVVTTIEAIARKDAPVKRSNLANSGSSEVLKGGDEGTVGFSAPYARYVHEGTGLYGPHKTKIVPNRKRALFWPGASHPVRSVSGMKGNPFLLNAAEGANTDELYIEGARNYLAVKGGS